MSMTTAVVTEGSMNPRPVGNQEMRFLQYVAQHGPISVGALTAALGAELGLARTTVQTILERLREKGQLVRRRQNGVFVYRSSTTYGRLMRQTVSRFVDERLAGSI